MLQFRQKRQKHLDILSHELFGELNFCSAQEQKDRLIHLHISDGLAHGGWGAHNMDKLESQNSQF